MWHSFKNICHNMIENHVPTRSSSTRFNQPWINRKVKSLSRKKQRQWNTARKSGKKSDWARYKKLQKQQKQECRKAYNTYVNDIVSPDFNTKPKKFWQFIKSKQCDTVGVCPLRASNGLTYTDSYAKAEILNETFKSVFNVEKSTKITEMGSSKTPILPSIQVKTAGVLKLLSNLDPTRQQDLMKYHLLC